MNFNYISVDSGMQFMRCTAAHTDSRSRL